jgi:hypothetical protein
MPSPEINLDFGATVQQSFALSSADSTTNRDKDKYPVDDIRDPTPCTLMYVKGRTLRTIEVAEAQPICIFHGRPVPVKCAVVEVTTIREGHEFENLDYPDEEEGIEKLIDAKGTFILWPRKDNIVKTHSSLIVLPWSTETGGTPTSNMSKPTQITHPSATPLAQNSRDPELQESMKRRPTSPVKESESLKHQGIKERTLPSPVRDQELKGNTEPSPPVGDQELLGNKELTPPSPSAQVLELQGTKEKRPSSPPGKDKDLQDTTGNTPPPPPIEDICLHPSTKHPKLQPSTDRAPPTQQQVYEVAKDSSSSGFFVSRQKV